MPRPPRAGGSCAAARPSGHPCRRPRSEIIGTSSGERDVLEPVDDEGDLLGLVFGLGGAAAPSACNGRNRRAGDRRTGSGAGRTRSRMFSTGARGLRATQQEQVLPRSARSGRATGTGAGCWRVVARRAPSAIQPAEDLLADILDLDCTRLVREVRQSGLHRDEPVEQVQLVVLEADVEDVRLAARSDVARHLQGHRGLAGPLRTTDQRQAHRLAGRCRWSCPSG